MRVALVVSLLLLVGGCAFMDAVSGVDREGAYYEGQRQRAEYETAMYEAMNARDTQVARERLKGFWQEAGMDNATATNIAAAFDYTPSQAAVLAAVRSKGIEATGADLRKALGDYNYLLANQLALSMMLVAQQGG